MATTVPPGSVGLATVLYSHPRFAAYFYFLGDGKLATVATGRRRLRLHLMRKFESSPPAACFREQSPNRERKRRHCGLFFAGYCTVRNDPSLDEFWLKKENKNWKMKNGYRKNETKRYCRKRTADLARMQAQSGLAILEWHPPLL